jgi:hypothetical protein
MDRAESKTSSACAELMRSDCIGEDRFGESLLDQDTRGTSSRPVLIDRRADPHAVGSNIARLANA